MIPYGRQDIQAEDIEAVQEVMYSDFLTQGERVPEFERQVAAKVGSDYAVAANSATSALHIACLALGLGNGDRLWTTPNTFVASANCGLYCGAEVDFVDIDPKSYNISTVALRYKLEQAQKTDTLPKVLVVVHFAGQSADMAEISVLARQYGFRVIEDASHAIGGKYKGHYIGNCVHSDVTVFSFHPVKIITTAEGGLAVAKDSGVAERMALYRSHGVSREPHLMHEDPHGPWYYEQVALGYNYRMTELQAALGISQLSRLDKYVARRHELARLYDSLLERVPVTAPYRSPQSYSGMHLYPIRVRSAIRRKVFESLRSRGIGVNVHYIPVHTQPKYRDFGFAWGDFPNAESYYREAISLPLYPGMSESDVHRVVLSLDGALSEFS